MNMLIKAALVLTVVLNVAIANSLYGSGFDNGNFDTVYFDCAYSAAVISQNNMGGSIKVTAPSGCKWQAVTGDSWINITSGNYGNGNGIVNYSVPTGIHPPNGTITIAGQTVEIGQAAAPSPAVAVPTITEWGMMLFIIIAGLGSLYRLKRQAHC